MTMWPPGSISLRRRWPIFVRGKAVPARMDGNYFKGEMTPSCSRNRMLATAMAELNMIDTSHCFAG